MASTVFWIDQTTVDGVILESTFPSEISNPKQIFARRRCAGSHSISEHETLIQIAQSTVIEQDENPSKNFSTHNHVCFILSLSISRSSSHIRAWIHALFLDCSRSSMVTQLAIIG